MAQHGVIYTRLMNCSQWREIRQRQLWKMPYCEVCLSHGVVRADKEMVVHHIVEVEVGRTEQEQRELAYSETVYQTDDKGAVVYGANGAPIRLSGNLQTVCKRCHAKIHKELRSHSRKVHQERTEARLAAWIAQQRGDGINN